MQEYPFSFSLHETRQCCFGAVVVTVMLQLCLDLLRVYVLQTCMENALVFAVRL